MAGRQSGVAWQAHETTQIVSISAGTFQGDLSPSHMPGVWRKFFSLQAESGTANDAATDQSKPGKLRAVQSRADKVAREFYSCNEKGRSLCSSD